MRVEFTRRATRQLEAILTYLHDRNPAAATKVADNVAAAVRLIGEYPEIGRRQQQEGVRKYVVQPGGYLFYYLVDREAERIRIFYATHPARRRRYHDA